MSPEGLALLIRAANSLMAAMFALFLVGLGLRVLFLVIG